MQRLPALSVSLALRARLRPSVLATARNVLVVARTRSLSTAAEGAAAPLPDDVLVVTPRAARRLASLRARGEAEGRPGASALRLRVKVEGGGCSGFKYDFALEYGEGVAAAGAIASASASTSASAGFSAGFSVGASAANVGAAAAAVAATDAAGGCVDEPPLADRAFRLDGDDGRPGVPVVVDEASFGMVRGSALDWEEGLLRSAFVVAGNPQAESACGCKSSFALKQ
jgi:Fe-S cluster assembly iron-binding protein IscA